MTEVVVKCLNHRASHTQPQEGMEFHLDTVCQMEEGLGGDITTKLHANFLKSTLSS